MSHLLDVDLLLACGWNVHADHAAANRWLDSVKAFATSSPVRLSFLPNIPTIAETGVGKLEMETWFGPFVVKATPQAIVDRLRTEFYKTMAMPDVVERFEKGSGRVLSMSPGETEKYVASEIARWTAVIKKAGITIQE